MLPFAAPSAPEFAARLRTLKLPHWHALRPGLRPQAPQSFDDDAFSLPHENALGQAWGWRGGDGLWPLAAQQARADGLDTTDSSLGWGLLTPCHWQVGADQVLLLDPELLALKEDESRAFFDVLRGLFESEGWQLHWAAPLRWYAAHPSLATLRSASVYRAVGQPVDRWLGTRQAARTLRRLQSEAQMMLYTHPLNAQREARGALALNSFWLSGTGQTQPADAAITVDDSLRCAALAGDVAAWEQAWVAVDAGALRALLGAAQGGQGATLILAGHRGFRRFDWQAPGPWQRLSSRWQAGDVNTGLETL